VEPFLGIYVRRTVPGDFHIDLPLWWFVLPFAILPVARIGRFGYYPPRTSPATNGRSAACVPSAATTCAPRPQRCPECGNLGGQLLDVDHAAGTPVNCCTRSRVIVRGKKLCQIRYSSSGVCRSTLICCFCTTTRPNPVTGFPCTCGPMTIRVAIFSRVLLCRPLQRELPAYSCFSSSR